MSQEFVGTKRVPVTLVKTGPCIVTQIKTNEKDGYNAVQLGYGHKNLKNITKPMKGHLKGATEDKKAPRFLCEVKADDVNKFNVGDEIKLTDVFTKGDMVTVTGITKGKGFAGVIKRWGFSGYPRTHGHHGHRRRPGSIGQGTTPGRVWKGKKMAGRMGTDTVSVSNLQVISINANSNEMAISGTIPGNARNFLVITKTADGEPTDTDKSESESVESKGSEDKNQK